MAFHDLAKERPHGFGLRPVAREKGSASTRGEAEPGLNKRQ